jgi:hypothetical protein
MSKYALPSTPAAHFLDFVFFNEDNGEITITKVPSTPKNRFKRF